jgi:hypothetical protein
VGSFYGPSPDRYIGTSGNEVSITLMTASFSVDCNLITVSTKEHAAPTAMVGRRLVAEPKHAGLVLTAFHEVTVSGSQQNGCGFCNRCQDSFGCFDGKRARLFPHQRRTAFCMIQGAVEQRRIAAHSDGSFHNSGQSRLTRAHY